MSASLFILLAFGVLSFKLSSARSHISNWKGYYQLLYNDRANSGILVSELRKAGIKNIITEDTVEVPVFSYDGLVMLPLRSVKDLYVENDPLYDPFLKGLSLYFKGRSTGKDVNVAYISADYSPMKTYFLIKKAVSEQGIQWSLVEFNPLQRFVFLLLAAGLNILLLIFSGDRRKIFFFTLGAWVFPLLFGDLQVLIAAASCQFSWILLSGQILANLKYYLNYRNFDEVMVKNGTAALIFAAGVSIAVFTVLGGGIGFLIPFTSIVMMISGTMFLAMQMCYQHMVRIHRLFFPVKIMERRKAFSINGIYAAGLFFFLLLFAPFLYQISAVADNITAPAPLRVTNDREISFSALRKTFYVKDKVRLPDLSDYIAHIAFLEGYKYGRPYEFPSKDEEITIPVYKKVEGIAYRENLIVKMFTDSWYESIITTGNKNSLIAMLINQKSPVGVESVDLHRMAHVKERLGTYYIFYVFLLIPFLFWVSGILTFPEDKVKRLFIRRRRQVV